MSPKVAIIVPVYNQEKYLRKCLDSLVNQTFRDIEIICFNDASTDSSLSILQEYAANDNRIIIIDSKVNIKQGGGRNAGIRKSTAPYIMFVDPDDWVAPEYVKRYYTTAIETGADLVTSDYYKFENGHTEEINPWGKNLIQNTIEFKKKRLEKDRCIWSGLYKRNLFFDNNLFFPECIQLGEDNVISSSLYLVANKIRKIDDNLYYYRIHNNSSSRGIDVKHFNNLFMTAIMTFNNLRRFDPDKCFSHEINQLFIHNYFSIPIHRALNSFGYRLLYQIKYAAKTVIWHVSREEVDTYINRQPRTTRLVLKSAMVAPIMAYTINKSYNWFNKLRNLL